MTRSDKVKITIVYGIPCVGKSTTAIKLASQRNVRTVIATDYIREVQRKYLSADKAPALAMVTHDAWKLYGPPTRANIQRGFLEHVGVLADAIKAVVAKVVDDGFDAILEGAHFHGGLIDELRKECPNAEIDATLLTVANAADLQRRVQKKEGDRALCAAEKKEWRENVNAMLVIQDFLITDARNHDIAIMA
jgi:2-phosphoglycerate kinase